MFSWLKQSGNSEGTQSEGYDLEYAAADFSKLLFLASISSCISSLNVICSLGPTNEDIEMAGESPTANVTTGETVAEMLGLGHASKDPKVTVSVGEAVATKGPDVIVTTREVVASVPSQGHIVSLTVHDVHHSKEPTGMMTSSHLYSVKQVSCSIILGCMNAFCYCWGHNHASFCRAMS